MVNEIYSVECPIPNSTDKSFVWSRIVLGRFQHFQAVSLTVSSITIKSPVAVSFNVYRYRWKNRDIPLVKMENLLNLCLQFPSYSFVSSLKKRNITGDLIPRDTVQHSDQTEAVYSTWHRPALWSDRGSIFHVTPSSGLIRQRQYIPRDTVQRSDQTEAVYCSSATDGLINAQTRGKMHSQSV